MNIENEDLKKKFEMSKNTTLVTKKELHDTARMTRQAICNSNYNEQYSRKNNIKVFNFPRKQKQNLRQDFIETVRRDLKVDLEDRDVVAIHRLPSNKVGPRPMIVKVFNSDVKRSIMRERQYLQNDIRFSDDVTKRNVDLMERMRETDCFDSVWYFNCNVYGRIYEGLQLKFDLFDDIHLRLKQGK